MKTLDVSILDLHIPKYFLETFSVKKCPSNTRATCANSSLKRFFFQHLSNDNNHEAA
jgi:hypothetical protein